MWDKIFDRYFGGEPPYGPNKATGNTAPAAVRLVPRSAPQSPTYIVGGEQHSPEGERAYAQFNAIVERKALKSERSALLAEQRLLLVGMAGWYFDAEMIQRRERAVKINVRVCEIDAMLDRMEVGHAT